MGVLTAPIANEQVGTITADLVRAAPASGESPRGDVIADAQLAATQSNNAQIAITNPGGIRTRGPRSGQDRGPPACQGLRYTETCSSDFGPNGAAFQSPQRCSRSRPASCAIRSISWWVTWRPLTG